MLTQELPRVSWEWLVQSQGSRVEKPVLGICSPGGAAEPAASLSSVPRPHHHLGVRVAAEWGGYQLMLKPVLLPLLFCYMMLPTLPGPPSQQRYPWPWSPVLSRQVD